MCARPMPSAAMMSSHFMPVALNSDISHVMPVLNDLWLYIHTNVIIFSYCLIGMAAVTALMYLRYRLGGGDRDYAHAGGAGHVDALVDRGDPGRAGIGHHDSRRAQDR